MTLTGISSENAVIIRFMAKRYPVIFVSNSENIILQNVIIRSVFNKFITRKGLSQVKQPTIS